LACAQATHRNVEVSLCEKAFSWKVVKNAWCWYRRYPSKLRVRGGRGRATAFDHNADGAYIR
jgi:hypothetical protein